MIDLKLVAYSKLCARLPRQNTKGKSVDLIDLKLVAYCKLGTSFLSSRTPRVSVLT